jgi:ferredoxin
MAEYRHYHDSVSKPLIDAAAVTGELEPVAAPDPSVDVTTAIRTKARELGFGEVGFTKYDKRYTYTGKRRWIKYPNAICLALEQNYVQTQSLPSMDAEFAHFGTYEIEGALLLDLTDYIRTLGYHAQVHSPNDNSAPYIPMFVSAGLGQLGANGQLLSPHFGSRARLAIITTDAPVNYDEPVDYGIHKFCQVCQVCVNRCPGRAIIRDKVWWRGAEKNKLIYERCRPVMARYEGCAVCMKTCPIQRFGMKEVMEYYVATGEVLGKGTHLLEGYTIEEKGYFGPGDLPMFDRSFFEIPHGRKEEWLFDQFKEKLMGEGIPSEPELVEFAQKVRGILVKGNSTIGDE